MKKKKSNVMVLKDAKTLFEMKNKGWQSKEKNIPKKNKLSNVYNRLV